MFNPYIFIFFKKNRNPVTFCPRSLSYYGNASIKK